MIASRPEAARPRPALQATGGGGRTSAGASVGPRRVSGSWLFAGCLAAFIAVAVARIHEVVPGLAHVRPGKLLMLPMLVTAVTANTTLKPNRSAAAAASDTPTPWPSQSPLANQARAAPRACTDNCVAWVCSVLCSM